jgi:hypothetical protein
MVLPAPEAINASNYAGETNLEVGIIYGGRSFLISEEIRN